jgi:hypothetical protein
MPDAGVRRTPAQDDRDLPAGCILAWESKDHCDGLIDFWTMRVSDIDSAGLSTSSQRVVLWDDVFWLKTIRQRADEIKAAIPKHYGFDPRVRPNGFSFHADDMNTFDEVLAHATQQCTNPERRRPIGSGGSFVYESTWGNMQKCDFSVVYPDALVEEMGSLSDHISSLTLALNNQSLIRRLSKRITGEPTIARMFGISGFATRITDEGHFVEISARQSDQEKLFGPLSEEEVVLMLDIGDQSETFGTISLWPITMKWN